MKMQPTSKTQEVKKQNINSNDIKHVYLCDLICIEPWDITKALYLKKTWHKENPEKLKYLVKTMCGE